MKQELFKFIRRIMVLLVLVGLGFSPVLYFNVYIDPYGIFRSNFEKQRIEPNSHFIKLRKIIHNPEEFDSFIFGNSRANNIDNTKIPGGRYFNLYYSLGLPSEYLRDLRLLLKHDVKIKNILLSVDFSAYSSDETGRQFDVARKAYRDDLSFLMRYYTEYIFLLPDTQFVNKVLATPENSIYKNILLTGRAVNTKAEENIEKDIKFHISQEKFLWPTYGYENHIDNVIATIDTISRLCKSNNIALKICMNPVHKATFLGNNRFLYFDFFKKLSHISNFYDFSGMNKVTTNNYFYYESSHFRPIIGDAMIDFMYKNKRIDSIPDFGFFITKENVESRINTLENDSK